MSMPSNATLLRLLPFLRWWPLLDRKTLSADLVAGITVSLLAIPQSLAYAQLAGVPAYYGLYAALIPTIIGALFGSSAQLSTGPVAMTSLLTAASVSALAPAGSNAFYDYVVLLALVSGIFQVLFGLARMGMLLNFLSQPVLMGFINAAAIIISLSQFPALVGISTRQSKHLLLDTWDVLTRMDDLHLHSLALGGAALVMLLSFRRFAPKLPGVLITVALLTWVSYAIDFAGHGGRVVGEIPRGLPSLSLPALDLKSLVALLPAGFVLALISFMEAMSSCKVIAMKTRSTWDENQELLGQGLAKVASALCHSLPVSGSFSRSALNLSAKATTGVSSLISAAFVLLTLLFFTPLLYHLPKSVLAAIIMLAVFGLIDLRSLRNAWRASRDDGVAAAVTFLATLGFAPNIQNGILTGILLSLSLFLYRGTKPRVMTVGLHPDGTLRDARLHGLAPLAPSIGALRFDASLNFVNAAYLEEAILELEHSKPGMRALLLVAGGINGLDASGAELISTVTERLRQSGIVFAISSVKRQVMAVMERTGLADKIGRENIFPTDRAALDGLLPRFAAEANPSAGAPP
ncbi:MAG TPA: SulP family inorganic anion transporter [Rhodocyclaceae bacterium]|nr:SulP family inorganic anion transporter [Rhodocyclaceae bacterium]